MREITEQHVLLKFVANETFAKNFLDGMLYMNSLNYFWDEYTVASEKKVKGQMDLFEGVYCNVNPLKFGFSKEFSDALVSDAAIRAEGYKYCHVHSYCRLDYEYVNGVVRYGVSENMKAFGSHVVVIRDERKFLERIAQMAKKENIEFLCGNVRYRTPKKDGQHIPFHHHMIVKAEVPQVDLTKPEYAGAITGRRDAFDKMDSMSYQNEWRIAVYDGKRDTDAKVLWLEDGISDIACIVETGRLFAELDKMFQNREIKPGSVGWYGNIGRKEMRDKFYALGDYKGSVLGIIG